MLKCTVDSTTRLTTRRPHPAYTTLFLLGLATSVPLQSASYLLQRARAVASTDIYHHTAPPPSPTPRDKGRHDASSAHNLYFQTSPPPPEYASPPARPGIDAQLPCVESAGTGDGKIGGPTSAGVSFGSTLTFRNHLMPVSSSKLLGQLLLIILAGAARGYANPQRGETEPSVTNLTPIATLSTSRDPSMTNVPKTKAVELTTLPSAFQTTQAPNSLFPGGPSSTGISDPENTTSVSPPLQLRPHNNDPGYSKNDEQSNNLLNLYFLLMAVGVVIVLVFIYVFRSRRISKQARAAARGRTALRRDLELGGWRIGMGGIGRWGGPVNRRSAEAQREEGLNERGEPPPPYTPPAEPADGSTPIVASAAVSSYSLGDRPPLRESVDSALQLPRLPPPAHINPSPLPELPRYDEVANAPPSPPVASSSPPPPPLPPSRALNLDLEHPPLRHLASVTPSRTTSPQLPSEEPRVL
ncbi:hypothetical protein DFH27DRAFT_521102 [Peziza echinospora]|nr:hypothetical protein DFH27DRAFT_521102 [Peziza echinospora]